jgi:hypothetical protein
VISHALDFLICFLFSNKVHSFEPPAWELDLSPLNAAF